MAPRLAPLRSGHYQVFSGSRYVGTIRKQRGDCWHGFNLDGAQVVECLGSRQEAARALERAHPVGRVPRVQFDLPGAFADVLHGTSLIQGRSYSTDAVAQDEAERFLIAWDAGQRIQRGKGYTRRILVDLDALNVVQDYAETSIVSCSDEPSENAAELAAARLVLRKIQAVMAENGWRPTPTGYGVVWTAPGGE